MPKVERESAAPPKPRERYRAIRIANRILDTPYLDPDGDECILARQFLREVERERGTDAS